MNCLRTALFALALLSCAAFSAATPESVTSQILDIGAKATVARLYDAADAWQQLLRSVATGQRKWLIVANSLAAGTDGASAEDLVQAVADGLAQRPREVLSLSIPTFQLEYVCASPAFDDSSTESIRAAMSAILERKRKVARLIGTELNDRASMCLASLKEAETQMHTHFKR